jgi:Uma2 family endonuclease
MPLTHAVAELFPRQGQWTEEDYLPLAERNRIVELSEGELVIPAMPTSEHQTIVGNSYVALRSYIKAHNLGKVAMAPLPVRLWEGKYREPDVLVMLNEHRSRIHSQYWDVPDLVVEVLSPATQHTDRTQKLLEYAQAGIAEYWIVSPETKTVQCSWLEPDRSSYTNEPLVANGTIPSHLLPALNLAIATIFEDV